MRLKYFLIINFFVWSNLFLYSQTTAVQPNAAFKNGENLKYRIHYGVIDAGFASLKLSLDKYKGEEVYHAVGKGWTVGATKMFFTVKDTYESFFTKGYIKPLFHKRRVDENGYIIKRDKTFDYTTKTVTVNDLKKNTTKTYPIDNVQDMVSAFYYMRNLDISNIKEGSEAIVNLFFDGETFPFKLKFQKREIISTKFGEIKTWRIQPMVQKGRVFESNESLTIWVTDDTNKVPVRIKASLVVGSLKADLESYSGISTPFKFVE